VGGGGGTGITKSRGGERNNTPANSKGIAKNKTRSCHGQGIKKTALKNSIFPVPRRGKYRKTYIQQGKGRVNTNRAFGTDKAVTKIEGGDF